jgi:hypothetical protein
MTAVTVFVQYYAAKEASTSMVNASATLDGKAKSVI